MAQIGPVTKSGSFRSKKSTKRTRKSKSKAKKPMMIKTTQMRLPIVAETTGTQMHYKIDKGLSQANFKLYRQGMNYHARVSVNYDGGSTDTEYEIYTISKNHRSIGALRMARSIYNKALKDELEVRPEVKTPWTDFKIKLYNGDTTSGSALITASGMRTWALNCAAADVVNDVKLFSDSYAASQVTDSAGNQKYFALAQDADFTSSGWNVFAEYRNFLLNRADPDSAAETPAYGDASPVLTEMAELADKGDEPPYSWIGQATAIGGADENLFLNLQLAGTISAGINTRQQLQQFVDIEAPLGLIFVKATQNISTTFPELTVTLKSGNYKGVKADMLYPKDKLLGF